MANTIQIAFRFPRGRAAIATNATAFKKRTALNVNRPQSWFALSTAAVDTTANAAATINPFSENLNPFARSPRSFLAPTAVQLIRV